jgi:hypothetical protein
MIPCCPGAAIVPPAFLSVASPPALVSLSHPPTPTHRCASDLVSRFREREESVKICVMGAYCDLVKQVCVFVCV